MVSSFLRGVVASAYQIVRGQFMQRALLLPDICGVNQDRSPVAAACQCTYLNAKKGEFRTSPVSLYDGHQSRECAASPS